MSGPNGKLSEEQVAAELARLQAVAAQGPAEVGQQGRHAEHNGGGDQDAKDAALLAGVRDGAWLDAQTFPPLRYAVPGLLPEGFTLLVGPPKIGKSWFTVNILLAGAAGGYALSALPVGEPHPTLYLALEDSDRRMQDRCRTLLGPDQPIPPRFHYLTKDEPGQVLDTIGAFLRRHPDTSLVVVDTLGKVMPTALPGESAYQRDYRVGSALQQVALDHPGLAVVVNHHDRKAVSDDFIDSVSGTHGLAGAADSVFVLTRHRNETDGLLKVTGRDIPEAEYALVFEAGHRWRLDGDDLDAAAERAKETRAEVRATVGVSDRMAEVIGHVLKHPQGVTLADVATALGMPPNAAGAYLGRAVKAGRLAKPSRGLYTPVESVESVESEGHGPAPPNTAVESVENDTGGVTSQLNTFNTFNTPPGRPSAPGEPATIAAASPEVRAAAQEREEREAANREEASRVAGVVDRLTALAGGGKEDRHFACQLAVEAPDLADAIDAGRLDLATAAAELERRQAEGRLLDPGPEPEDPARWTR